MTFKHKLAVRLALMRDALCRVPARPRPVVTCVFPIQITAIPSALCDTPRSQ